MKPSIPEALSEDYAALCAENTKLRIALTSLHHWASRGGRFDDGHCAGQQEPCGLCLACEVLGDRRS